MEEKTDYLSMIGRFIETMLNESIYLKSFPEEERPQRLVEYLKNISEGLKNG